MYPILQKKYKNGYIKNIHEIYNFFDNRKSKIKSQEEVMKKWILTGVLLAGISSFSDEVNIRAGLNAGNWYSEIGGFNTGNSEDLGFEFTVEYMKEVVPNFKLGIGTGYQANPKIEGKNTETEYYVSPGVEYEAKKGFEDKRYYDSIPVYITGKYEIPINDNWGAYAKLNLGYSFNLEKDDAVWEDYARYEINDVEQPPLYSNSKSYDTKIKDGFYYALGGGVKYKSFYADIMYQTTFADIEVNGEKDNLDYSRVTLGVGYSFGF
jgi:hypothetical protein